MPEVALLLVIIPVGFIVSFIIYYEHQSYYPSNLIRISIYGEINKNLKKQMLLEIEEELKKNNLEFVIKADTTANELFIYQPNAPNRQIGE